MDIVLDFVNVVIPPRLGIVIDNNGSGSDYDDSTPRRRTIHRSLSTSISRMVYISAKIR